MKSWNFRLLFNSPVGKTTVTKSPQVKDVASPEEVKQLIAGGCYHSERTPSTTDFSSPLRSEHTTHHSNTCVLLDCSENNGAFVKSLRNSAVRASSDSTDMATSHTPIVTRIINRVLSPFSGSRSAASNVTSSLNTDPIVTECHPNISIPVGVGPDKLSIHRCFPSNDSVKQEQEIGPVQTANEQSNISFHVENNNTSCFRDAIIQEENEESTIVDYEYSCPNNHATLVTSDKFDWSETSSEKFSDSDATSKNNDFSQNSDDPDYEINVMDTYTTNSYVENLSARVEANKRRNTERLRTLGLEKPSPQLSKEIRLQTDVPKHDDDLIHIKNKGRMERDMTHVTNHSPKKRPRGMLFSTAKSLPKTCWPISPTCTDIKSMSEDMGSTFASPNTVLDEKYPYRSSQIRLLLSIFDTSVRLAANEMNKRVYVPAPVFCYGPSGTGKSFIVRDVLHTIKSSSVKYSNVFVGTAYIDIATMELPFISSLLEDIYFQLSRDFSLSSHLHLRLNESLRLRKKAKLVSESVQCHHKVLSVSNSSLHKQLNVSDNEDSWALNFRSVCTDKVFGREGSCNVTDSVSRAFHEFTDASDGDDNNIEDEDEDFIEKEREGFPHRNFIVENSNICLSNGKSPCDEKESLSINSPTALGRSLYKFVGPSQHGCAFVVLDNAERIFELKSRRCRNFDGRKNPVEPSNLLAQLLLLPKVMGLNVTFVLISQSILLDSSRINNTQHSLMALGSVLDATCPVHVHFNAYQRSEAVSKILLLPHIKQLIVGPVTPQHNASSLYTLRDDSVSLLYKSMVESLIQSLDSMTHNIGDFIRLSRLLWPVYLSIYWELYLDKSKQQAQASPEHIRVVNSAVFPDEVALLQSLGQKARPHIRHLITYCLPDPAQGYQPLVTSIQQSANFSTVQMTPYLTKFLLLSAFLCQRNKSDHDQSLFTSKTLGRKRSKPKDSAEGVDSVISQELKTFRVPSFPLERMLSVFSSIVCKYAKGLEIFHEVDKSQFLVQYLGSISFFESLSELRQLKLLILQRSTHENLTAKYTCQLPLDEAIAIAKEVSFPLEQYLMEDRM